MLVNNNQKDNKEGFALRLKTKNAIIIEFREIYDIIKIVYPQGGGNTSTIFVLVARC